MKNLNYKYWFFILLIATFVVNLIQAYYTGIISDEAYYALYGAYLDWGYFDHPPAVALLTRTSSLLFPGSLGIRFATTVIHILTLFIVWKVIDEKPADSEKVLFFFLIASSFVMFTVYGFVTTPDVPLLFFTALFLYAYKRFLQKPKLGIILFLGFAMAGLVYSKYQAALVIGFVVFSNISLLKNGRFWISAIIGLILLIPHFYWLYDHGFPTFRYQLIDRATEFKLQYIIEYIPNTSVAFNPFVFGAVIYVLIRYRPGDLFERAMYFLIIGFISFFWISGFRGHVQPQWTVATTIPMIIILYNRIQENKKLRNYTLNFIFPTFLLLLLGRVLIVNNDFVASKCGFEKEWPKTQLISKIAGDLPVLFQGSFQESSKYHYFSSKNAFPLSSLESRHTQFDIWQFEKQYNNKPVFVCAKIAGRSKKMTDSEISIWGFVSGSLQTVNRMLVDFRFPDTHTRQGDTIVMQISVHNTYPYSIDFHHIQFPVKILSVFTRKGKHTFQQVKMDSTIGIIDAGGTIKREIRFVIPKLNAGNYTFGLSLSTCLSKPLNSKIVKIKVE